MLNITNNDKFNSNNIKEQADILKVGMSLYKGTQQNSQISQLFDETDISNKALNLYQKELDIKNFTQLALSNPENSSHIDLTIQTLFAKSTNMSNEELANSLLGNDKFLSDLFG